MGLPYHIQSLNENTIMNILEHPVDLLLYDMDGYKMNHLDTLRIIRNLISHLPIVVLTDDNSLDTMKYLAQLSIYYCALKPIRNVEIESVIHAVRSLKLNRKNCHSISVCKNESSQLY